MRISKSLLISTAIALSLSACVSGPTLAPKGNFTQGQSVTLDRDWSNVSTLYIYNNKKVKLLTIDGALLNRLYVTDGLSPEDPFLIGPRGDTKNNPAPRGKANMSLSEQIEFVSRAVSELDYLNVETASPKPVTLSGTKGVRFEMTMRTKDGLNMKGLAQAVSKDSKSYYIVYLAPTEHYYGANLANAVAVMDSATLP